MELSRSTDGGRRWRRGIASAALLWTSGAALADAPPRALGDSINGSESVQYALAHVRSPVDSIRLFGNYYFFDPGHSNLGPTMSSLLGGFRASTGLAGMGRPASLFDAQRDDAPSLPYIGLGYSHLWFNSQLSLNADFGLASQNPAGAGRVRGLFNRTQSLDDVTGDLRWAPVMAVNVRYSF